MRAAETVFLLLRWVGVRRGRKEEEGKHILPKLVSSQERRGERGGGGGTQVVSASSSFSSSFSSSSSSDAFPVFFLPSKLHGMDWSRIHQDEKHANQNLDRGQWTHICFWKKSSIRIYSGMVNPDPGCETNLRRRHASPCRHRCRRKKKKPAGFFSVPKMYEEQTEEKGGRVWERKRRRIERFISGDRRGRERKGKCAFSPPPPPPGFCKSILPRKRWKEEEEDQDGEIFVGSINHELFFLGKKCILEFLLCGEGES